MNNETNNEPASICRFCGKEIKHFHGNLYHEVGAVVFPQYCANSDPEKASVMHSPLSMSVSITDPLLVERNLNDFEKVDADKSTKGKSRWSPEEFDRAAADIGVDPKVLQRLIAAENDGWVEVCPLPVLMVEQIMSNPELRKDVAAKYAAYQLEGKKATLFELLKTDERIEFDGRLLNDFTKGLPLLSRRESVFELSKMIQNYPPNGYKTNVQRHLIQKAFGAGGVVQEDGTIKINLETTYTEKPEKK